MASYLHVPIMVCGGLANGDFSHLRDEKTRSIHCNNCQLI